MLTDMFNATPRRFNLNETKNIWIRENDSKIRLSFYFKNGDTPIDVSDYVFSISYAEIKWDFMPAVYDLLEPGEFDMDVFDISDSTNGNVNIDIPLPTIWRNKTVQCQLLCDNGEDEWVVCEFHITVYFSD